MKKSALVTLGLIIMVIISFSFTKDEPRYKNLKVLPKNITKEQLDSVMHHFAGSLGVRCAFCHKHSDDMKTWDFASDENKHKLRAREMMKMMEKINKKFFDVAGSKSLNASLMITCYTCHHGNTDVATKPPMQPRPDQRPQADSTRRNGDSTRHN